jgi:hypothetical protein
MPHQSESSMRQLEMQKMFSRVLKIRLVVFWPEQNLVGASTSQLLKLKAPKCFVTLAVKVKELLKLNVAKQQLFKLLHVIAYRTWLADIISESERLYRSQSTALTAAEAAIAQSREKLDSAFTRLNSMKNAVESSFNQDGTVKRSEPIRVESKRTRAAIVAPKKTAKKTTKKKAAKRK